MRTIIAGSRNIRDQRMVDAAIAASGFVVTEVVCGGALGVDLCGAAWGRSHQVPVKMMPADWNRYGRSAGMIRNRQMGDYAEALVAVWDGKSRGTAAMIAYANEKGLRVFVQRVDPQPLLR